MIEALKSGQLLTTESRSETVVVEKLLGSGGQGEVYQVKWNSQDFALKWYYPHTATGGQLQNLRNLVALGVPDSHFLWPLDIIPPSVNSPSYGYLMPLRDGKYSGIIDLMARRSEPTFRALCIAGLQLANCYLRLHSKGLCYCDISFGNVFWNDKTGDVLICDNDNVIENGKKPEIAGTIGFMAPELTVIPTTAIPSIETDKHSLAVLLFYMFMLHHPLKGNKEEEIKALDLPARVKIYGREPLFIFHPTDESNRPHPIYHQAVLNFWPIYPRFLKDIFIKAFTQGLEDPAGRVTENEWRTVLTRLIDSIYFCSNCSTENFYDQETLRDSGGVLPSCWFCKKQTKLPFRIRLNRSIVMLNHDSKLYSHHIEIGKETSFSLPIAEIAINPQNLGQCGLKNLGLSKWTFASLNGNIVDVDPGRTVALIDGLKINFGSTVGDVRL
jgi:serine/threonine protein kinase